MRTRPWRLVSDVEVNLSPGWRPDATLNMMATAAGLRYSELRLILEAASERVAAARPWLLAMAAPERVAIAQR